MKIAIIFAAGSGTRLLPITNKRHKALIKFNGLALIEHTIKKCLQVPNLEKIIIITGYLQTDFAYLTNKYVNVTLVYNDHYLDYDSAYALSLVTSYFDGNHDLFLIAGDMVSTNNDFTNHLSTNVMAAIKRNEKHVKTDWSYQLNSSSNIIDIIKSDNKDSLLAGEWTYITKEWAKLLGQDLENQAQAITLQTTMIGKYLINNSINNQLELKPYILDFNCHWDIDNIKDLVRTKKYLKP